MTVEYPYANKPEDITRILAVLPTIQVPAGKVDSGYIKSLGFSAASSKHLFNILKMLGFINEKDEPSADWLAYAADDKRGMVLAAAVKKAYAGLFEMNLCPYLEDDDSILEFLKQQVKASARDIELMLETFRTLSEPADFQELLCVTESRETVAASKEEKFTSEVNVNPNLQLNVQIHIAPDTPDEKIEVIFKNMRRYLLGNKE